MKIINASVYTEESRFVEKDIFIKGEYFADQTGDTDIIDARGCYVIPGLTDIHFHGCAGYDFCEGTKEALHAIANYEASVGVTTIIPATMTLPYEDILKICRMASAHRNRQERALDEMNEATSQAMGESIFCGINLEGPFVSGEKLGAQNPKYLREPDQKMFERLQEECAGFIKLVDLAPELPGALEFIRENKDNTVISLAHTAADYDMAMEAFEAGACHVTHLFNAMNPFGHRQPGVIGAAADAGAYAELICDGVHIHPSAVRGALKLFGEDKIIFISDSMMATGLSDGNYQLGGQPVKVVGNKAYLADGTIAGSVTNLMECVRRAVTEMQIPLETAVKCAAVNPAKHMRIYDKYGSISNGKVANLVLLDKETLKVKQVILKGKVIFPVEKTDCLL